MEKRKDTIITAAAVIDKETFNRLGKDFELSSRVFSELRDNLGEQVKDYIKSAPMEELCIPQDTEEGVRYTIRLKVESGIKCEGICSQIVK